MPRLSSSDWVVLVAIAAVVVVCGVALVDVLADRAPYVESVRFVESLR